MADNEQQMVLVAKLVDDVSGKLKEINKAMLATESAAKKAHREGAESAEKHRKQVELLEKSYDQLKEAGTELIKPGFAALGVSAFSLAGAIGAVVDAVKELGEQGVALEKVRNRTGMMADSIRQIQGLGDRWGISIGQTNDGLSQFGDMLARTNRLAPDALRQWMQMPGAFELLGSKLKGLNTKEAFDRTMDFIVRMPRQDQRRRLLGLLGLPLDLANFTKETLEEGRRAEEEFTKSHPFAKEMADKADENFTRLKRSFRGLKDDLGGAFGGPVNDALEQINKFFENPENVERITRALSASAGKVSKEWGDVAAVFTGIKSTLEWIDEKLGNGKGSGEDGDKGDLMGRIVTGILNAPKKKALQDEGLLRLLPQGQADKFRSDIELQKYYTPMSFGSAGGKRKGFGSADFPLVGGDGFNSETAQHVEDPIYRGTLHALQDWYQQLQSQAAHGGGGGGGFMGASFGGSNGAAHESIGGGGGGTDIDGIMGKEGGSGAANGGPFDRTRFRDELKKKPWLVNKLMRIAANEQGKNPLGTQGVIEETMNRANMRGTSLEKESRWTSEGGYYQNGNMGAGFLEHEATRKMLQNGLKNALNGDDTIGFGTDNSSQGLAERERASGKFVFHKKVNGESFFHPGTAEPAFRRRWEKMMKQQREFEAAKAGTAPRSTVGRLLGDQQSFSDRWNDRVKGGQGSVTVDFKNMPSWAKTAMDHNGMFKEFKVNRGTQMPRADEGH